MTHEAMQADVRVLVVDDEPAIRRFLACVTGGARLRYL